MNFLGTLTKIHKYFNFKQRKRDQRHKNRALIVSHAWYLLYLRIMSGIFDRAIQRNFVTDVLIKTILCVSAIFVLLIFRGRFNRFAVWSCSVRHYFRFYRSPEVFNVYHFPEFGMRLCHVDRIKLLFSAAFKTAVYKKINNNAGYQNS